MIRSFADETTRDLFMGAPSKAARRIPRDIWPIVLRKLKQLDLVMKLDELTIPPGNRLERLKGDLAGRHSIRVNDRYRITFVWENNNADDVCCEDYH